MKTLVIFSMLLAPTISIATETEAEKGEEYRGWCTRSAKAERIPAKEQEDFIRACMELLSDVDSDPDNARTKKAKREDG